MQPMFAVEQKGNWKREGEWGLKLHRAKVELECDKKLKRFSVESAIQADFAENTYEELLEKAYVRAEFFKPLCVTMGKFKAPFGANLLTKERELWTVYRSHTSDHIKDDLQVGSYRMGATVSGKLGFLGEEEYAAGIFYYEGSAVEGLERSDIVACPVAYVSYSPFKKLTLSYGFAAPEPGVSLVTGERETYRMYLHDIGVELRIKKWLQFFAEGFVGVDTTKVKTVRELLPTYNENVAYSLYALESSVIDIGKKASVRLTGGIEFLNGLEYVGLARQNRDYYFASVLSACLRIADSFSAQASYDNRYDHTFSSTGYRRMALQFGYDARLEFGQAKKGKKKKEDAE